MPHWTVKQEVLNEKRVGQSNFQGHIWFPPARPDVTVPVGAAVSNWSHCGFQPCFSPGSEVAVQAALGLLVPWLTVLT